MAIIFCMNFLYYLNHSNENSAQIFKIKQLPAYFNNKEMTVAAKITIKIELKQKAQSPIINPYSAYQACITCNSCYF